MAIEDLLFILGDENGVVYYDGEPMLKIRRYDGALANGGTAEAKDGMSHDGHLAKPYTPPKPGDYVSYKGRLVKVPELDADGNRIPDYV